MGEDKSTKIEDRIVSVVCISYNHENYIIDCLESILYQTYPRIELIVADDKSQDTTYEKIKEWCGKNKDNFVSCIYYSNEQNLGVVRNINKAINMANGEYIKLIATDDFLLKDSISKMVEFTEETNSDYIFSNAFVIDENTHFPIDSGIEYKTIYNKSKGVTIDNNVFERLYRSNFIAAPTVFLPRKTYLKYGMYSERYSFEDYEFNLRLAKNNAKIAYLNEITTAYRVLKSSESHFDSGVEEEKRFKRYNESLTKILKDYSKDSSQSMERFYLNTIITCILFKYDGYLDEFYIKERDYMSAKCKCVYYLETQLGLGHFLRFLRSIIRKIKGI